MAASYLCVCIASAYIVWIPASLSLLMSAYAIPLDVNSSILVKVITVLTSYTAYYVAAEAVLACATLPPRTFVFGASDT